jgi:iron complex transport system ATP-binding protein
MHITVECVSFSYDGTTPVLEEIGFTVRRGELLALIGPNGSGKTTLLKVISGVLRPSEGSVLLGDSPVHRLSARRIAQRLAMVEQDRQMGFDFAVREVVAMGRIAHRGRFARESARDRQVIARAMALADVSKLAGRSIQALSGGERQRVFLAMALAQEPKALLLDEPTTHLDLRHQVQFMSIVGERANEGTTVLVSIHDLSLAAQATDRITLMSEGRIVVTGKPSDVLTRRHLEQVFEVDVAVGSHPEPRVSYVLPLLPGRT